MQLLELFCGTKSMTDVFSEYGWDTLTVDVAEQFDPDICIDILDLSVRNLPDGWKHPDVVWASPPCTTFSVASLRHYWVEGRPSNRKAWLGIAMVQKTLQLIEDLKPRYWFIENPRGMLRKQWFMESLHRKTVTYCQYGDFRQKPTDIWTNAIHWCPRPCCRPGDPCHESAKRGSDKGTQNLNCAKERAKIPRELCLEVCRVCGEVGARQEVLSFACEAD